MALSLTDVSKTAIVAGQKIFASNENTRLDVINANNAIIEAKTADISATNTFAEVQTFTKAAVFSAGLSCNTKKITAVLTPAADTDAATKKYVDDNAGGTFDGSTVTGTLSTTGSWQENGIDFSGVLDGGVPYLCHLLIENKGGGDIVDLALRAGGSSVDVDTNRWPDNLNAGLVGYMTCISSTAGKFDYYLGSQSFTATLLGYVKLTS